MVAPSNCGDRHACGRVAVRIGNIAALLAGCFLLFIVGRGMGLRWVRPPLRPQAQIIPPEVNLGDVFLGDPIKRTFALKNAGTARLLIKSVRSTCQCTVPEISSKELAPGASEFVTVTFTATNKGTKLQRVVIETNDPQRPASIFTLRAEAAATSRPDER